MNALDSDLLFLFWQECSLGQETLLAVGGHGSAWDVLCAQVVVCSSLANPQCQSVCSLKPAAPVSREPAQGVKQCRGIPAKQLSSLTGSSWVSAEKPWVGFLAAVPQAALTAELFAHHSAPWTHSCTVLGLSSTAGSSTQGGAAGLALGCWQRWPCSVRVQCSSSHSIAASSWFWVFDPDCFLWENWGGEEMLQVGILEEHGSGAWEENSSQSLPPQALVQLHLRLCSREVSPCSQQNCIPTKSESSACFLTTFHFGFLFWNTLSTYSWSLWKSTKGRAENYCRDGGAGKQIFNSAV